MASVQELSSQRTRRPSHLDAGKNCPPFSLLLSLPDEHLPTVLSHLTLNDILRLRLVSSDLFQVVFPSTHHLWMNDEEEKINILNGRGDGGSMMSARRMRSLLQKFPKLRALRISGIKLLGHPIVNGAAQDAGKLYYDLIRNAECTSTLESLELLDIWEVGSVSSHCSSFLTEAWTQELQRSTNSLSGTTERELKLENLSKLSITGMLLRQDNKFIHSLLRSSHHLTNLHLGGCRHLTDDDVEGPILTHLKDTLTHLTLTDCTSIRYPTIRSSRLKILVLSQCVRLVGLRPLSFCPNLDSLQLSFCSDFGTDGSPLFAEGSYTSDEFIVNGLRPDFCPRLRTLNLQGCIKIKQIHIFSARPKRSNDVSVTDETSSPTEPSNLAVTDRLRLVDLRMCTHLEHISISSPSLERIELSMCTALRSVVLSSLVMKRLEIPMLPITEIDLTCPSLVDLSLAGCCQLSTQRVHINCPQLEQVDVCGSGVTPDSFSVNTEDINIDTKSDPSIINGAYPPYLWHA